MSPVFRRMTFLAAVALAAACGSEESPMAPSLAKGGAQLSASPVSADFDWPPGGSEVITVRVQYVTTVSATSSSTACATVSPTSAPTRKPRGSAFYVATFTVTAAGVGNCSITLKDKNGKSATVSVTVSAPLPDRIVYTSDAGGNSDIFVMDLDGSHKTQLTSTEQYEIEPALSPNGRKIAFVYFPDDFTVFTKIMNVDGSGLVTLPLPTTATDPTFSPDGKHLAFTVTVNNFLRIFTSDASGANQAQVTPDVETSAESIPSWAGPLPGRIAFSQEGPRTVALMNPDGSGRTELMPGNDPLFHQFPTVALSPDGQRAAFSCQPQAHVYDICIVNVDGTGFARLTDAEGSDRNPRWTRDGRIVFNSQRDGNQEIYIMNADGTGQTNLTMSDADESLSSPGF